MRLFSLKMCDPSGLILSDRPVEAADVYGALAEANRTAIALAVLLDGTGDTSPARIDVADQDGRTVGRLFWADVMAATA